MISASLPPLRMRGACFLMPMAGVLFKALCGGGIFLGTVGDVRWGPADTHATHTSIIWQSNQIQPLSFTVPTYY